MAGTENAAGIPSFEPQYYETEAANPAKENVF